MNAKTNSPSPHESQVELSTVRTLQALNRTLLAWIRTSLSLNGFGFSLAKFVHSLIVEGSFRGIESHYPRILGLALMLLGMTGLLAGAFEYWRAVKQLKPAASPWSASLLIALLLALLSLVLMVDLFAGVRAR